MTPLSRITPFMLYCCLLTACGVHEVHYIPEDRFVVHSYDSTAPVGPVSWRKNEYDPAGADEYILKAIRSPASVSEYPDSTTCIMQADDFNGKYAGRKGYFPSKTPILDEDETHAFSNTPNASRYRFNLDWGETIYICLKKRRGFEQAIKSAPFIMSLEDAERLAAFRPNPLCPGSTVLVDSTYQDVSGTYYKTSSGQHFLERDLRSVRTFCASLGNKPEIGDLLSKLDVRVDGFDRTLIVSSGAVELQNGAAQAGIDMSNGDIDITFTYSGEEWIFLEFFKVRAGDSFWESPRCNTIRRTDSLGVTEMCFLLDEKHKKQMNSLLELLVSSDDVMVRMYGDHGARDSDIPYSFIEQLRAMYKLQSLIRERE